MSPGAIATEYLREIMTTMGDRWTDDMVDELFHGAPINSGVFDYLEFTRLLKHGADEQQEQVLDSAPSTPRTPAPAPSKFASFPAQAPQTETKPFWKKGSPPPKPTGGLTKPPTPGAKPEVGAGGRIQPPVLKKAVPLTPGKGIAPKPALKPTKTVLK